MSIAQAISNYFLDLSVQMLQITISCLTSNQHVVLLFLGVNCRFAVSPNTEDAASGISM